jgi:ABC-type uncharacterized transport system ATPase subunit
MKSGQIIEQGTIAELTASHGAYEIIVAAAEGLSSWLREHSLTYVAVDGHFNVQATDRSSANALIDALRSKGVEIESVSAKRRTLETVFLEKVSE